MATLGYNKITPKTLFIFPISSFLNLFPQEMFQRLREKNRDGNRPQQVLKKNPIGIPTFVNVSTSVRSLTSADYCAIALSLTHDTTLSKAGSSAPKRVPTEVSYLSGTNQATCHETQTDQKVKQTANSAFFTQLKNSQKRAQSCFFY